MHNPLEPFISPRMRATAHLLGISKDGEFNAESSAFLGIDIATIMNT